MTNLAVFVHALHMSAMLALIIFMAKQDWKNKEISLIALVLFSVVSFVSINLHSFFIICAIALLCYCFPFIRKGIAIADIIIIVFCTARLPIDYIGPFLFLLGASASIYSTYNRDASKEIPLVPFILLAYLIVSILLHIPLLSSTISHSKFL